MLYEDKIKKMHLDSSGYKVLINVDGKQQLVSVTDVILDKDYTLNDMLKEVKEFRKYKTLVDKLVVSNNAICEVGKFMKGKIK